MQRRRADWSFRLKEEFKHAESAYFVTLTYSDEMIPRIGNFQSLDKKHIQNFIKKLRRRNEPFKLRYYAVGEYGTKTHRPHYHVTIFNLFGDIHKHIQRSWCNGKKISYGGVHIGNVTDASIHYQMKYHVNPNRNDYKEWYGVENEFALMSTKPPIGYQYLERVGWWNKAGKRGYLINNGFKQALPRYYREKVFNMMEKDEISKEQMMAADKEYARKIEELTKLGFENPEYELEVRLFEKSLMIEQKARYQSKF